MSKPEDPIAKLEEQITCAICLDRFKEPKVLQCHHTYCKKCLEKLLDRAKQTMVNPVFECPECRKHTPVPLNGAAGLDTAFQTVQIMELREALKRAKGPLIVRQNTSVDKGDSSDEGQEASPPSLKKPTNMCPRHKASERKLYCECGEVICFQCLKDHPGHKYDLVSEVADKHREELKYILNPLENKVIRMERALTLLGARSTEVSAQRDKIELEIHTLIEDLHQILNTRKESLMVQLEKVASKKLKELNTETDYRETVQAQLSSTAKQIKEVITVKSEVEMVERKAKLFEQAEEASKAFGAMPDLLNIDVEADIVFSSPPNIKSSWVSLGQILTPSSPDPANCICTGQGLEAAKVEETAVITMEAMNYLKEPIEKPIPSLKCNLTYQETPVRCEIDKKEGNRYEISFMPTNRGKHELHITIEDEHIKKSPFFIKACVPVEKLGETVMTIGSVRPWGSVINKAGELIVTECNVDRVQVYSLSGKKLKTFGSGRGPHIMQFHHPCGVTVDDEDHIYVAEGSNYRIQKFTREGQHIGFVGQRGNKPQDFAEPKCISFNPVNQRIYVTDLNSVKVYNKDLTFLTVIGGKGNGKGKFSRIFGITCAPNGNVYVSDLNTKYIQVFNPEGEFLFWFQNEVARALHRNIFGGRDVASPKTVFANKEHLYVSSDSHYNINVFTLDGRILHSFGHDGFDSGQFRRPHQIAVSETGMVYVNDYENDRIQAF